MMQLGAKGPAVRADLQAIIEEGPNGKAVSDKIFADPEDPKKQKYDELKKKALLLAHRRNRAGEEQSDTSSVKSGTSKQSESQISFGTVSAGTISSVAGPFLTHARGARSEAVRSDRHSTPPKL